MSSYTPPNPYRDLFLPYPYTAPLRPNSKIPLRQDHTTIPTSQHQTKRAREVAQEIYGNDVVFDLIVYWLYDRADSRGIDSLMVADKKCFDKAVALRYADMKSDFQKWLRWSDCPPVSKRYCGVVGETSIAAEMVTCV